MTLMGDSCGEINQTPSAMQSLCFLGWLLGQEGFMKVLPLHGILWGLVSLNNCFCQQVWVLTGDRSSPVAEHKSQSSVLKTPDVCCVSLMWESVDLLGTHVPKGHAQKRCQRPPVILCFGRCWKCSCIC